MTLDGSAAAAVVDAVRQFDQGRAVTVLEAGTREAVVSTVTWLGAALVGAVVLTSVMQTGTEDFLALCLCGAGAYAGVVTLPLRRAAVKEQARGQMDEIQGRVKGLLGAELEAGLATTTATVLANVAPIERRAEEEKERVGGLLEELEVVERELAEMRRAIAAFDEGGRVGAG